MIDIRPTDPQSSDARMLIAASEAELAVVYPPEQRFALSPEELAASAVWFVIAYRHDTPAACGGLQITPPVGEIKRLFVLAETRGQGFAKAILSALEQHARQQSLTAIRLETGPEQGAAIALYSANEYEFRTAFGDYPDDGTSLFMEKALR